MKRTPGWSYIVHSVPMRKTVSEYLQLLQLFILSCTAVSLNLCVHETMDMHMCTVSSSRLLPLPFPVLLPLHPLFLLFHWRFCCSFKVKKMAWCQLKISSEGNLIVHSRDWTDLLQITWLELHRGKYLCNCDIHTFLYELWGLKIYTAI